MKIDEKIEKIIFKIIDEKNIELNLEMEKSLDTIIIGKDSELDSLGVFSFVLDVEKEIENEFDKDVSLINDEFFNNTSNHMENIKNLKIFLIKMLSNI